MADELPGKVAFGACCREHVREDRLGAGKRSDQAQKGIEKGGERTARIYTLHIDLEAYYLRFGFGSALRRGAFFL